MSNSVFVPTVLLGAFDFQTQPTIKANEDRRTQSSTEMKANECSF